MNSSNLLPETLDKGLICCCIRLWQNTRDCALVKTLSVLGSGHGSGIDIRSYIDPALRLVRFVEVSHVPVGSADWVEAQFLGQRLQYVVDAIPGRGDGTITFLGAGGLSVDIARRPISGGHAELHARHEQKFFGVSSFVLGYMRLSGIQPLGMRLIREKCGYGMDSALLQVLAAYQFNLCAFFDTGYRQVGDVGSSR